MRLRSRNLAPALSRPCSACRIDTPRLPRLAAQLLHLNEAALVGHMKNEGCCSSRWMLRQSSLGRAVPCCSWKACKACRAPLVASCGPAQVPEGLQSQLAACTPMSHRRWRPRCGFYAAEKRRCMGLGGRLSGSPRIAVLKGERGRGRRTLVPHRMYRRRRR